MNFSLERDPIFFSIPLPLFLPSIMLLMTHKKLCITFHMEGEDTNEEDKRNNIYDHGGKNKDRKNEIKLGIRLV